MATVPSTWTSEETNATREAEFCFAADRGPVTPSELETGIRRMGFARTDLLDAVRCLRPPVLDWRPPLSAAERIDSWASERRTIRGILAHIASSERLCGSMLQWSMVGPQY